MGKEYRIFGPPGTGKTTTLGKLVAASCQEYGSESVIAASFTRTAARELVSRDLPINDERIGTLHALCYRTLDRPTILGRAHLQEWNTEHPNWMFEGAGTSNLDDPYGDPEASGRQTGDTTLQEYHRLRGLQYPRAMWPVTVQWFADAWDDFKSQTHTLDFTDLIETCLNQQAPIPFGAQIFFLDEVQDFSPLELALVRQWGDRAEKMYLVGDEDQCLYNFKGAVPDTFLSPALPAEQVRVLDQSYRIPRTVHASAVRWIERLEHRMPKDYHPRDAEGEVEQLSITYRHIHALKMQLEDWLAAGKTVAFLASCSFFIDPIKHQLRDWGIPFHNPYRKARGDWNPLTGRTGTVSAAARVLAFRSLVDAGAWWTYQQLWTWAACLEAGPVFTRGAKTAMRMKAEAEQTATVPVTVKDLDAWMPSEEAIIAAQAGDVGWLEANTLKSFQRPINYACEILREHGREALLRTPLVSIGTIHSYKGGEASIVVLFPDLSPAGFREWHSPGDGHDSVRRMVYVGMTRAREALYWAQPSGMSISGYL